MGQTRDRDDGVNHLDDDDFDSNRDDDEDHDDDEDEDDESLDGLNIDKGTVFRHLISRFSISKLLTVSLDEDIQQLLTELNDTAI